jgi:hypothetical protein
MQECTRTCTHIVLHTYAQTHVQVRNIPATATVEDVQAAIEAHGLAVTSVVFDAEEKRDPETQVALVRFPPLPLPWKLSEEDLAQPVLVELEHPEPTKPAEHEGKEGAVEKKEGEEVKKEGAEEKKKEGTEEKKEGTEEKKEGEGAEEKKDGAAPPPVEEEKNKAVLPAASPAKPIVVQPAKPLPDGRKEGDVFTYAHFVATRLMQRRLSVGDKVRKNNW